jgi:hypothetical protein
MFGPVDRAAMEARGLAEQMFFGKRSGKKHLRSKNRDYILALTNEAGHPWGRPTAGGARARLYRKGWRLAASLEGGVGGHFAAIGWTSSQSS